MPGNEARPLASENDMKTAKHTIQIRPAGAGRYELNPLLGPWPVIRRKVYADSVGNFIRLACRYAGKTFLVDAQAGDPGDPFRAGKDEMESLYIDISRPCQWSL